jgi:prepilin-type N-terminal cleavage/methylation domain-containing protein
MIKQKGFTLIELLVSMGIIAVLTGMAVFNFNQSRVRARDVQRKSDIGQLTKAFELFKNDYGEYPDPEDDNFQTQLSNGEYTKVTFNDPRAADWDTYGYVRPSRLIYYLSACLENTADSTKAVDAQCTAAGRASCHCGIDGAGVVYVVSNP